MNLHVPNNLTFSAAALLVARARVVIVDGQSIPFEVLDRKIVLDCDCETEHEVLESENATVQIRRGTLHFKRGGGEVRLTPLFQLG